MQIFVDRSGDPAVAIVRSAEPIVVDTQSALDLIAAVRFETGCDRMILPRESLAESFFDLRSGLAGEVLQKCINYQMKLAIVGDFSGYTSKALQALIRESNRGRHAFFLPTEEAAVAALRAGRVGAAGAAGG
jgi:hypothetical protein